MSLFTIILFIIVVAIIFIAALNVILNSRNFRIMLIDYMHKREIANETKKEILIEDIKNPNTLEEIIRKINDGEEVEIPLVAFNYIYRNIKKFSVISKDGKIVFVNPEDYLEFKQKALELLETKEEHVDVAKSIKAIKKKEEDSPIEVVKHDDGTIVKKDNVLQRTEIISPNGSKIFIDNKNDTMVSQYPKPKPEEKAYVPTKNIKENDREKKQLNQENKLLKAEMDKLRNKIQEKEKTQSSQQNIDEKINETLEFDEDEIVKKEILNNPNKEEKEKNEKVKEEDPFMQNPFNVFGQEKNEIIQNDDKFIKEIKLNDKIKVNKQEAQQKAAIEKINSINLLFNYFDKSLFLNTHISHKNIKELMYYLLTSNKEISNKCVIFDKETNTILLNLNWFIYRIWSLITTTDQQDTFLSDIYTNIDIGTIENTFLSDLINKINQASSFFFGSKIMYQEKKEDGNYINFTSVKISNDEEIYQGIYLYVFMSNKFGEEFIKSDSFLQIANNPFIRIDTDAKGKKIYFKDIIKQEVE